MKHRTIITFSALIPLLLFGILPISAHAATLYLESSQQKISVGDTVIVTAKINAEGKVINTIDGEITTKSNSNNVTVKEFSLASSVLGLWPRTPSLSKDGHTISFTGGVPGGFSIEGATVFKIIFEATKAGEVTISPRNISVYESDGKGTKLPVQFKNVTLQIEPKKAGTPINDEWQSVIASDITPPEDFIVVPGQDSVLFNGKKFVFFSAIDNQTGISYYDVSENGAPAVRSGSVYVLQDQQNDVNLKVTAYDKAGNKKVATYTTKTYTSFLGFPIAFFVLLIIVLIIKVILVRKSKNATKRE